MKRVFLIVLDSFGIGKAPDAKEFGDEGADTLKRISASSRFNIPTLTRLGLGNIDGAEGVKRVDNPLGAVAAVRELSRGKDTTIGHWEIAGIVSNSALPTYPNGFPKEILDKFSLATGRGVLCNLPYSGTDVIRDYGEKHLQSGDLIVYTSADSVFQIAAHEELVPPEKLYEYCRAARKILVGEHAVGRVIARPFIGTAGNFVRTANRHDFSIEPPRATMLDAIKDAGLDTIAVGKITDIFAGHGITKTVLSHGNTDGMNISRKIQGDDFTGLCFINLVDFDMLYGHRQDIDGYAAALSEFDGWLSGFIKDMKSDDCLIITADHGCDPGDNSTDHTRERVPLIVYGEKIKSLNLGTLDGFTKVAKLVTDLLSVDFTPDACEKIADKILKI
jgi:phosphopentomutase